MNHLKSTKLLFISLIIMLPLILFWRWVLKGEVLYWGTLSFQFWPWHQLVKSSLLNGDWPLWNPLLGYGTPLLANLQSAVFYPFNLIYLFMPVEHALTLSVIIHLLLAGLFMYGYARQLGLLPFAASVSAISYMFSGYFVGRTQFISMINTLAWFPLLLLLSDKLVKQPGSKYMVGLALILAIQLLAGHAQLWFYGLWLVGAYLIFRGWQQTKEMVSSSSLSLRLRSLLKIITLLALAITLALLLTAVQILPTAEFVRQSARSGGTEQTFALTYSFWPWRLITLLAPNFFGHPAQDNYWGYANFWEDHAYIGVLPFILALLSIWQSLKAKFWRPALQYSKIQEEVVPFFAVLMPISLLLAMGWNTPIYVWVFNTVPGFSFFQAPARLLVWYTIAMTVLAGIGVHHFEVTAKNRPHWRRLLAACIALTATGFLGVFVLGGRSLTFLSAAQYTGILLVLAISLLLMRPEKQNSILSKEKMWQGGVVLFISVDLLLAAWPLVPTLPDTIYRQPVTSAAFLKTQGGDRRFLVDDGFAYNTIFNQYFRFKTYGPIEVDYILALRETLVPNFGVYAQLPAANNNDPLQVGRWKKLINLLDQADIKQQARLLSLMHVDYFINTSGEDNEAWPVMYESPDFSIKRVPDVLPRAYFVSQVYIATDETEVMARLTSPDFDPRQEVVIIGDKGLASVEGTINNRFLAVQVNEVGPKQLQLKVNAPHAGFVVLTDTFYPGWQATVDNQHAQILAANLAFRAVRVEAGQHRLKFSYQPLSFQFGLGISLMTVLVLISWAVVKQVNSEQ